MIHQLTDKAIGVEVPADQKYFDLYGDKSGCDLVYNTMITPGKFKKQSITLPEGNWAIVGKANELTEEQWKRVVDFDNDKLYRDYLVRHYQLLTAIESGLSLLKSKSLSPDNILILIKQS